MTSHQLLWSYDLQTYECENVIISDTPYYFHRRPLHCTNDITKVMIAHAHRHSDIVTFTFDHLVEKMYA